MEKLQEKISDIEDRLAVRGIPLSHFYREARINATTWMRWRKGEVAPQRHKWRFAERIAEEMTQ